jgi:putative heme transporter
VTGQHGPVVDDGTAADGAPPSSRSRRVQVLLRIVLVLVGVLLVVLFRHRIAEWWDGLVGIAWKWVLLAAVVQLVSMQCLVQQLRILLRAGGGGAPAGAATSTIYAGNTISASLPFAGAAASAAYTYRRLHALGNAPALIGWVLAVSGIAATATLAVVFAVGSAMTGSPAGALGAFVATAAGVLPVLGIVLAFRHRPTRAVLVRLVSRVVRLLGRWVPALRSGSVDQQVDDFLTSLGSFRIGAPTAAGAGLLALANWLLDAACLGLSVQAVGAPVPWQGLVLAWAAGALVSSARLTPGGVGVVEAALASALVASGLPASQAVPAVLVYRLVSLWMLMAIGAVFLLAGSGASRRAARQAAG